MRMIPNAITVLRILITPLLIFCLVQPTLWYALLALVLFVLGAVSDLADGYVARVLKTQSQIGRHLDPIADKIFVLGIFIALAWLYPQQVPWWAVGIIILRDILITGLRVTAEVTGKSLPTIRFAKVKTAFQLGFLGVLLLILLLHYFPETETFSQTLFESKLVTGLIIFVTLVTCLTGLSYIQIYFHQRSSR